MLHLCGYKMLTHIVCQKTIDGRKDRQKKTTSSISCSPSSPSVAFRMPASSNGKNSDDLHCAPHTQNHNNSLADWWVFAQHDYVVLRIWVLPICIGFCVHCACIFGVLQLQENLLIQTHRAENRTNEQTNATPHARSRRASEIFMNRPSWCTRHVIFNAKSYDANEM